MKINIVYNKYIPKYEDALNTLEAAFEKLGVAFKCFDLDGMDNFGDITIAIGGDGTILRTARFYSENRIPVFGVNMGRLGFLSQVNREKIDFIVDMLMSSKWKTEERLMLCSDKYIALNDFVIKGCDPATATKFFLEINGKCVCDYIADGLIISTPTGSTAYGLSAGGPVVYPVLDVIIIVPICPHTLNVRPLVVPSTEQITVKSADKHLSLSADGYDTIKCTDKIDITTCEKKAILMFPKDDSFYEVLRNKLHWGISPEK